MDSTVTNIKLMKGLGILADRNAKSTSLDFKRYNLIYGFNGSGKSTLGRLFGSLEAGALNPQLPSDCAFDVELSDGRNFGYPTKSKGLDRRVLVFNSDFQERNFQWATGSANPVFFIGSDQAEAAAKLAKLETNISSLEGDKLTATQAKGISDKALTNFKRDRARFLAPKLHLGSRRYEAPHLLADYESWAESAGLISDEELAAAEETLKLAEPFPKLNAITLEVTRIGKAYDFILPLCSRSIGEIALDELKRFPDRLLWLREGLQFHLEQSLEDCLFCGNPISEARKQVLGQALDAQIDRFLGELRTTSDRLAELISEVNATGSAQPSSDMLSAELRKSWRECSSSLRQALNDSLQVLESLKGLIGTKLLQPAKAADISSLPKREDVRAVEETLTEAIVAANSVIESHNVGVTEFFQRKEAAAIAIRKHYIAEWRDDFRSLLEEASLAEIKLKGISETLSTAQSQAADLRSQIRRHGPAAEVINKLVASYLGHKELVIVPVEKGYEIHRHGKVIQGLPSEGEKTAIAISYFISTLESDGRKLKDLIVVVDDPVSSLDTKALNYACALVRNRLSNAAQLFILTHNQQCMNEFKKTWKNRLKADSAGEPTAAFYFMDVTLPEAQGRRVASLVKMSKLLREYDSEYHFLMSHVFKFHEAGEAYSEHGYMMPNVLRRVLDVFAAFKCPGSAGLASKVEQLCKAFPDLDRDRLNALERLSQVESHSDNLDDLISLSSMTLEETKQAAASLLDMMKTIDEVHLNGVRKLCN